MSYHILKFISKIMYFLKAFTLTAVLTVATSTVCTINSKQVIYTCSDITT